MTIKGTSEQLYRPLLRGPMATMTAPGPSQWAGATTLNSGSATVTVSTTLIDPDSLVLYGTQPNSLGVAANSGGAIVVSNVVDGVSFALSRATGVPTPWDETVTWMLMRT